MPSSICIDTQFQKKLGYQSDPPARHSRAAVHPDILEFDVERVGLAGIHGIAELTDQIGGLDQFRLQAYRLDGLINSCRKTDQLIARAIAMRRPVVNCQAVPWRTSWIDQRDMALVPHLTHREAARLCFVLINHKLGLGVPAQDSTNVANIVQEAGTDQMAVIAWIDSMR